MPNRAGQNRHRGWHDHRFEPWRDDPQPLHGTQHADGRSDDAVAEQQRRTDKDQHRRRAEHAGGTLSQLTWDQSQQRDDAAFAAVIRLHQDSDILQSDDKQQ